MRLRVASGLVLATPGDMLLVDVALSLSAVAVGTPWVGVKSESVVCWTFSLVEGVPLAPGLGVGRFQTPDGGLPQPWSSARQFLPKRQAAIALLLLRKLCVKHKPLFSGRAIQASLAFANQTLGFLAVTSTWSFEDNKFAKACCVTRMRPYDVENES